MAIFRCFPERAALIADFGSGVVMVGFAGIVVRAVPLLVVVRPKVLCILVGVDQKDNCAASLRPRSSPTSAWSWLASLVLRFALCSLVLSTGPRCSASWPVWTRRTVRIFFCGRVRRRQQQWHARCWFFWLNVSHVVFLSLSAGLLVRVFNVPAMSVAYLAILSPVASRDTTGIVMGQARLMSTTSVAC